MDRPPTCLSPRAVRPGLAESARGAPPYRPPPLHSQGSQSPSLLPAYVPEGDRSILTRRGRSWLHGLFGGPGQFSTVPNKFEYRAQSGTRLRFEESHLDKLDRGERSG